MAPCLVACLGVEETGETQAASGHVFLIRVEIQGEKTSLWYSLNVCALPSPHVWAGCGPVEAVGL